MDHFHEESVHKANTGLNTFIYAVSFLGMIISGVLALQGLLAVLGGGLNPVTIGLTVIFGLSTYGFFVLRNNQRIEYDYTFTNGILDIAKVINNAKRKKVLSADIREFEVIAPISDEGFERMLNHNGIQKKYNCFLNRGGGLYYGVFTSEGVKSMLVFEPSDEMLRLFKAFNPRSVKIQG